MQAVTKKLYALFLMCFVIRDYRQSKGFWQNLKSYRTCVRLRRQNGNGLKIQIPLLVRNENGLVLKIALRKRNWYGSLPK